MRNTACFLSSELCGHDPLNVNIGQGCEMVKVMSKQSKHEADKGPISCCFVIS